jgi:hypothetical protein
MRKGDRILVVPSLCTAQAERVRGTLASPFAGYSPINRGSTHCFTLSSVNLGVAYRTKERHSQRTCVKNNICIWIGLCHVIVKIIQSAILLSSKFWGHHCALRWSTPSEKLQLWCRCSQGVLINSKIFDTWSSSSSLWHLFLPRKWQQFQIWDRQRTYNYLLDEFPHYLTHCLAWTRWTKWFFTPPLMITTQQMND